MTPHTPEPNLDGHVDWIIFDRSWGTLSEPCATEEEARDLSARTGGGNIYQRQWGRIQ